MDYSYSYSTGGADDFTGLILGMLGVVFFFALAVGIFMIIVNWKLYQKAGKPGWASIVPFYRDYILAEISWGNGWFFLITFASIVPVVGYIAVLVYFVMSNIKLAKAFGKDGGFAVGLIFLNPIFLAILAFGKSQYVGVDTNINPFSNNNNNGNYNNQYNNGNYQNNMNYNNGYNNQDNNGNYQNNMNYNNGYNNQNNFQNNNQNNDMMSSNTNQDNMLNENQSSNLRFCTNCGTKLENNASFCTNCGTKVN